MAEQAETSVPSEQPAQIEVNSETATPKEDSQEPKTGNESYQNRTHKIITLI